MPDAINCVMVTHTMVVAPKVVLLMPSCAHGETDDSPNPVPSISRIKERAAAPAAPAKMAGHDTAPVEGASVCVCTSSWGRSHLGSLTVAVLGKFMLAPEVVSGDDGRLRPAVRCGAAQTTAPHRASPDPGTLGAR